MSQTSQYLLALYVAEREQDDPVAPGDIAAAVERSPAATTEMLQRLETRGLVSHEPYDGATLTDEGRAIAEELHDNYVTLSRFFRNVLDLSNHEQEAMRVAGTISPVVVNRLASTLPLDVASPSEDSSVPPEST